MRSATCRHTARSRPATRRRGVIPNDLRRRINSATLELGLRMATRVIASGLDGVHPAALSVDERRELLEALLAEVGYGQPRGRRARSERELLDQLVETQGLRIIEVLRHGLRLYAAVVDIDAPSTPEVSAAA